MQIPTQQTSLSTSILLVGAPFTGKTQSIATIRPVLVKKGLPTRIEYFNLDGPGGETLKRIARKQGWADDLTVHEFGIGEKRIGTTIKPGRSSQKAIEFINEFNLLFNDVNQNTKTWQEGKARGLVVVDSITALQDSLEDFVFVTRGREIGEEGNKAITFNDWRLLAEKITETYMSAMSLPCYSLFTAHVQIVEATAKGATQGQDKSLGELNQVPLVTGQLKDRIEKDFGVVLYTTNDFKWFTRPNGANRIRTSGSRFVEGLPPIIEQDFAKIL
jgi:hypothetical protein